jgi:hypothetical protein
MSQLSRVEKTQTDELPADLMELLSAVAALPESQRAAVNQALNRVVDSTKRRRRILTLVQDALGQLRLDMNYLRFYLEATRRERDDYRRQADET